MSEPELYGVAAFEAQPKGELATVAETLYAFERAKRATLEKRYELARLDLISGAEFFEADMARAYLSPELLQVGVREASLLAFETGEHGDRGLHARFVRIYRATLGPKTA